MTTEFEQKVYIEKIKLINFKRFREFSFYPNKDKNIIIGDNESGKSSIIEAIDYVLSGSVRKIESAGIERLMNVDAVKEFLENIKVKNCFDVLPKMQIELYINGGELDPEFCGKNNTDHVNTTGIRLICEPDINFQIEIIEYINKTLLVSDDEDIISKFPFDFYKCEILTFGDHAYSSNRKGKINHLFINNSRVNSEYATKEFVKKIYERITSDDESGRINHKIVYRELRSQCNKYLTEVNGRLENGYQFGVNNAPSEFYDELMIYKDGVALANKGEGEKVFIKTQCALDTKKDSLDCILIEEPENHLSHIKLRQLINIISGHSPCQTFITTHNSLICTGLSINNIVMLHRNNGENPITLKDLSKETARNFLKAPPASILEFVLSTKAILVEGPSEFMLINRFYESICGHKPEDDGVHVICVRGLSFLRYLEISKITKGKVAVITDNDGDFSENIYKKYYEYSKKDFIKIFTECDEKIYTFEVAMFNANNNFDNYNLRFGKTAEHAEHNKTDFALELLELKDSVNAPKYIEDAIKWINND